MRCSYMRGPFWLLWTAVLAIPVVATAEVVDFDDLSLDAESAWIGPDPLGVDAVDPWGGMLRVGNFHSRGAELVNRYNTTYGSWSGFAYSNMTDTTTPGFGNLLSAYAGSGCDPGEDNYAIGYGYVDQLDTADFDQLQQLPYIELPAGAHVQTARVTNTTYTALSMLQGDSFSKQFGGPGGHDPDWLQLTVYGTDTSSALLPESVSFFLADYRSDDDLQDYLVKDWTTVDLSQLTDARRLYFNLASSDVGDWGMNTPASFAIDQIVLTEAPEPSSLVMMAVGACVAAAASIFRRRGICHGKYLGADRARDAAICDT